MLKREIEIEAILAIMLLALFSFVIGVLLFRIVPTENKDFTYAVLIALTGLVKDAMGRYFQATKGAQEQRKEAAQVARTLAETAATVATSAAATGTTTADGVTLPPGASVEVRAEDTNATAPDPSPDRPAA